MNRIRLGNLSTSYSGERFATVSGTSMAIWDLASQSLVNCFSVLFEHGDYRIAISNDGSTVVVGTWRVHGIGAYDTNSGQEVWRRQDLKRCHRLTGSRDGLRVSCEFEDKAFRSLNLKNGKERTPLRGVEHVHESYFENIVVHDRKGKASVLRDTSGKKVAELKRFHWGAPAIAFGPGLVCMGGNTTACYSTSTGKLLWEVPLAQHFGEYSLTCDAITFCEPQSVFVLIIWSHSPSKEHRCVRLDATTGRITEAAIIEAACAYRFCLQGTTLLTSWGDVYRTLDLSLMGSLPFHKMAQDLPAGDEAL